MRCVLCCLLILFSAPLAAQETCPSATDLDRGIRFGLGNGEREVYRSVGDSVVEVIFDDGLGFQSRTLLGQGLYLLEIVDLEDGLPLPDTRATYSHGFKPADMPPPQPEMVWASKVATTGDGFAQELHDHRGGALSVMTVGSCRYDTFRVTVTYDDDENTVDVLQYVPQLGIALLVGVSYDGEDGLRETEVYSYLKAAVVTESDGSSRDRPRDGFGGRKERLSD